MLVRSGERVREFADRGIRRQASAELVGLERVVRLERRDVLPDAVDKEAVEVGHERADTRKGRRDRVELHLQEALVVVWGVGLRLVEHVVGAMDAQVCLLLHTLCLHEL